MSSHAARMFPAAFALSAALLFGSLSATAQPGDAAQAVAEAPPSKAMKVPSDLPVVKTTDLGEGLIAEDLKIGEGMEVKPGTAVVAHYHGTLKADGKVIDSSYERGEPMALSLTQLIPGWQKGVAGMKIGGIRRLIIPGKLGWGERGNPPLIPANADVVFIVQMVDAVQIEDLKVGDGEVVGAQAIAVAAHTMKTADGKDVDSATREKPYVWIPGELAGIEGMKVGGKRRISIPAQLNRADPRLPATRPHDIAVVIEVDLLAVRNLTPPSGRGG